jgi:hypothetical protein
MKKGLIILAAAVLIQGAAWADAVFVPPVADVFDLDHYYAYTWGIDLGFSTTDTPIVEAVLTFTDIYNWRVENDHLYVHLLDNAPLGLRRKWDAWGGGDYFKNQGVLLANWNDPEEWNKTKDLVITLDTAQLAALNSFGADGRIAFGLDPDCHYYNKGVSFSIRTYIPPAAIVPAPAAVMLSSVGLVLVGWLRTRKSL